MRTLVCMGITALVLALAAPVFAADAKTPSKPKDSVEITGEDWLASSQSEKLSFLLGVELTIATEQYMADQFRAKAEARAKDGKSKKIPAVRLSPFARGWLKVFGNTTRPELVAKLDGYLEANPTQRNRHIFDILWKDFIEPGLQKDRPMRKGVKS